MKRKVPAWRLRLTNDYDNDRGPVSFYAYWEGACWSCPGCNHEPTILVIFVNLKLVVIARIYRCRPSLNVVASLGPKIMEVEGTIPNLAGDELFIPACFQMLLRKLHSLGAPKVPKLNHLRVFAPLIASVWQSSCRHACFVFWISTPRMDHLRFFWHALSYCTLRKTHQLVLRLQKISKAWQTKATIVSCFSSIFPKIHINFTQLLAKKWEAYECIELFSGTAWVSRAMRKQGHATASLDILNGQPREGKMDNMDMTTAAGMAFLALPFIQLFHKDMLCQLLYLSDFCLRCWFGT